MMKIKHLYIHIPFCKTICAYCDFCHVIYNEKIVDKYLDKLNNELLCYGLNDYETIYIGGGTPSSLNINQLTKLFEMIKPYTNNVIEYTIEVNPESLDLEKIKLFKSYGINRVSMGLESSNDNELKLMNRNHSFKDVKDKVNLLKQEGINNISLDIIYSLPNQTLESLKHTVEDALSLDVEHLSLYSLTIEPNTIFSKKGYKALNSDIEADMYEYIVSTLTKNNYKQYEIANFARDNYYSKHNTGYWKYNDFVGVGAGASGKINDYRYDNKRNINEYINTDDIKENKIILSKEDKMFENLMMSLRTLEGLDLIEFNNRYHEDALIYFKEAIEKNKDNLIIKDNHLRVLNREILNHILVDFV